MQLGSKGHYAVLALLELAQSKGQSATIPEIANRQLLPAPYLEQLFSKLRAAGILKSIRGQKGGYQLNHEARDIPIAKIILAVEDIQMTRCKKEESSCRGQTTKCATHALWEGLGQHIIQYLSAISLDDLRKGRHEECLSGL